MAVKTTTNAPKTETVTPTAPRFDSGKINSAAARLWALGYDGWDSSTEAPLVFSSALGRPLSLVESSDAVTIFRGVVYGTTDGSLRRVKGAKASSKAKYLALGTPEGLAAAFHKALNTLLDTPAAPAGTK